MKRDIKNKMIFGVCAGVAKRLEIDVLWVRLLFAFFFLQFGVGLLLYLLLALLMPVDKGE